MGIQVVEDFLSAASQVDVLEYVEDAFGGSAIAVGVDREGEVLTEFLGMQGVEGGGDGFWSGLAVDHAGTPQSAELSRTDVDGWGSE